MSSLIKNFLTKLKDTLYKLVLSEKSAHKVTLSFCLGTFIALTPTMPLQTPLLLILGWIFKLNTPIALTFLYIVNTPLTMVPIYIMNYMFGSWLFESVLKINMIDYNPQWVDKFSNFLNKYISLQRITGESALCFWCLILGGLILPLIISIILYPLTKPIFKKLINKIHKK